MAEVCYKFEFGPDTCAMFCKYCGHSQTAHVEYWGNLPYDRIEGGALVYGSPAFLGGMGEDNE